MNSVFKMGLLFFYLGGLLLAKPLVSIQPNPAQPGARLQIMIEPVEPIDAAAFILDDRTFAHLREDENGLFLGAVTLNSALPYGQHRVKIQVFLPNGDYQLHPFVLTCVASSNLIETQSKRLDVKHHAKQLVSLYEDYTRSLSQYQKQLTQTLHTNPLHFDTQEQFWQRQESMYESQIGYLERYHFLLEQRNDALQVPLSPIWYKNYLEITLKAYDQMIHQIQNRIVWLTQQTGLLQNETSLHQTKIVHKNKQSMEDLHKTIDSALTLQKLTMELRLKGLDLRYHRTDFKRI